MPSTLKKKRRLAFADMVTGSAEWKKLIEDGASELNIQLLPSQTEKLSLHVKELLFWNDKTNLTAITAPYEVAIKHVVDSLAVAKMIHPEASLLDVGSGGGFPGIPIKIMIPSLEVTLIDSSRKKNSFQLHVIRMLGLSGIKAIQGRIEEMRDDKSYLHAFSVIICRAFTNLKHFIEVALPLLSAEGTILAMKGKMSGDELKDASDIVKRLEKSGLTFSTRIISYRLPFLGDHRHVYMLKKEATGENIFPG